MKRTGFTLIEVLVAVAIIAILAAVMYSNFGQSSAVTRDAERKADLRAVQSALELYKLKYGRYPERCAVTSPSMPWSGQDGTSYECDDGSGQYIVGLAPEFMPVLPYDQKINGANSGYVYTTNTEGTVYKFMAKNTVESEVVGVKNELKSCELGGGACDSVYTTGSKPAWCDVNNSNFQKTYAVWGGYPFEPNAGDSNQNRAERMREAVICNIQ